MDVGRVILPLFFGVPPQLPKEVPQRSHRDAVDTAEDHDSRGRQRQGFKIISEEWSAH
jgi:hypothetical protein